MVRSDLLAALARDHPDLSSAEIERLVTCLFDAICRSLANGGRVELRGFGTFSTRAREGRIGRNPRSGALVQVAAKRAVYFKPERKCVRGSINARLDSV